MSAVTPSDAFALLMDKAKKEASSPRQKSSAGVTEFVLCPAGCGKRMHKKVLNSHLDQCIGQGCEEQKPVSSGMTTYSQQRAASDSGSRPLQRTCTGANPKKRRVTCPACENSFPTSLINLHLDQCTRGRIEKCTRLRDVMPRGEGQRPDVAAAVADNDSPVQSVAPSEGIAWSPPAPAALSDVVPQQAAIPTTEVCAQYKLESNASSLEEAELTPTTTNMKQKHKVHSVTQSPNLDQTSVFAKMMEQSKTAFYKEKAATENSLDQLFHLDENGGVTLNLRRNAEQEWSHPIWSAIVTIKDKLSHDANNLAARPPLAFDVTLSSSVPCHGHPVRWVHRHSRLSVPVLKSILQKAIRRRRPLPAVRVAMELADKSLGDLLRRLPIIVLEDSTLHPNLDFLVWIMMAHSKEFVPPPHLMTRVFEIVYEIASCQWSDPISADDDENVDDESGPVISLTSLLESSTADALISLPTDAALWSMLVRAEYGGMRGDVLMLQTYVQVWHRRFEAELVPEAVAARLCSSASSGTANSTTLSRRWSELPALIHRRAREQSNDRVSALCTNGIDRLYFEDISVEGLDFHCSAVIDELLADQELCGICHDLVVLSSPSGDDCVPESAEGRRTWLESFMKSCMWNLSSSVNRRRPLLTEKAVSTTKDRYSELWTELIAPKALAYQKKYVEQRLA